MQRADGTVVNKTEEALNTWKDYFCDFLNPKAGHKSQTTVHPIESLHLRLDVSKLNETISYEEVRQAVYANGDEKSPGLDQIKPLFIKNEACVHFLHPFFNYCFQHGVVPNAWFETVIKPIPKSNPHSPSPSDYRSISLQSLVAKTYCRILNSRLREWLEHNEALRLMNRMDSDLIDAVRTTLLPLHLLKKIIWPKKNILSLVLLILKKLLIVSIEIANRKLLDNPNLNASFSRCVLG